MKKKQTVTVLPIIMDTEDGPVEELVNLDELSLEQLTEMARVQTSLIPYVLSRYLEDSPDKQLEISEQIIPRPNQLIKDWN